MVGDLRIPFVAMWMEIGWALYFQVVGTHKHYMWSSKYFLPQVVGTLKPSIEMLSLPLLCVCSFLLLLLPVHSPSLPFPPLCSLNSLDPSLTLPHRWWGPFHLVYKYPYWLPLTKMLGPMVGTYKALLWLCEWRLGGHCTSRWWDT